MASTRSYPGLERFDVSQRDTIRLLWDRIHALEGLGGGQWRGHQDANAFLLRNLGVATEATDALSRAAGDARYSASVLRSSLQAGGSSPLNVGGLRGILAEAQAMGITVFASASAMPAASLYAAYQVVLWHSSLYYANPTTNPFSWTELVSGSLDLDFGTLSPDTKPTLTAADEGYLFASTDFNRIYRWNGTAWADFPGSDPRGVVVWSYEPTLIPNGWALCDGAAATRSLPTGGTMAYTTPDLLTGNPFTRSAAVEGGTGTFAAAGATQNYYDLVPYIRL